MNLPILTVLTPSDREALADLSDWKWLEPNSQLRKPHPFHMT